MDLLFDTIIVTEQVTKASQDLQTYTDSASRNSTAKSTALSLQSQCSLLDKVLLQLQQVIVEPSRGSIRLQPNSPLGESLSSILDHCKTVVTILNKDLNTLNNNTAYDGGGVEHLGEHSTWNEEQMGLLLQNLEGLFAAIQLLLSTALVESPAETDRLVKSRQHLRVFEIVSQNASTLADAYPEHTTSNSKSAFDAFQSADDNQIEVDLGRDVRRNASISPRNVQDLVNRMNSAVYPQRTSLEYPSEQGLIPLSPKHQNPFDTPSRFKTGFRPLDSHAENLGSLQETGSLVTGYDKQEHVARNAPELLVAEAAANAYPELDRDRTGAEAILRRYVLDESPSLKLETGGQIGTSQEDSTRVIVRRVSKLDTQSTAEARREVAALTAVLDPCIPRLSEWLELESTIWLVLDHMPGHSLRQYVQSHGSLPDDVIKSVVTQLFSGIATLFMAGFAHLRICDQSLFLDDKFQLIIKDFQFAYEYGTEKSEDLYAPVQEKHGFDIYMAPEVFASPIYNARKAVIWSSGVVLYYMTTGQTDRLSNLGHPSFGTGARASQRKFSVPSQQALKVVMYPDRLGVPSYARDIISKMLQVTPTKRAELIEVAAKVPKELSTKKTRPLMELAWLDYKTHVGPLAGLDSARGNASSASSIFSATGSTFSNSLGALLPGRRRSSVNKYRFT